jgi:hypothetical protein
MYLITATFFGLFYTPLSDSTLDRTQACVPRNIICELANFQEQFFLLLMFVAIKNNL